MGEGPVSYPDEDLLEGAIRVAREAAQTAPSGAEDLYRLAWWLEELRLKRAYVPLRCKLGLHWETFRPGTAGRGRKCPLCGKVWDVAYP